MILVTGANGTIGQALCNKLDHYRSPYREAIRSKTSSHQYFFDLRILNTFDSVLKDINVVVHTAGLAHLMNEKSDDLLSDYYQVNAIGTIEFAKVAALNGIKRFIYISSINVNGSFTTTDKKFSPETIEKPYDISGHSKFAAEKGLQSIAYSSGMEVVIIRPPLVYGPGVKGNFASLIKMVEKGLPLPLGSINNQRSLVALDNLVDLIITCIDHPAAANQVFLAGDGEDISTSDLLRGVARAMGKPSRLIPVPSSFLMFAASILGKRAVAQRLLGSLQVDISKARELLDWTPPISVEEGLRRCFESPTEKDSHQ